MLQVSRILTWCKGEDGLVAFRHPLPYNIIHSLRAPGLLALIPAMSSRKAMFKAYDGLQTSMSLGACAREIRWLASAT